MKSLLKEIKTTFVNISQSSNEQFPQKRQRIENSDSSETIALPFVPIVKSTVQIPCIIFQGHEGFADSVTHYYHFFFGALIPLIEFHLKNKCLGYRICTDIGPMKSILCELPLNFVEFCGPENTKTRNDSNLLNYIALPAYDVFNEIQYRSSPTIFSNKVRLSIIHYFSETIPSYIKLLPIYEIILIERTNNETYYKSIESNIKNQTSGAQLRSINNHNTLCNELNEIYQSKFQNISLERMSIYYQYHLFSNAKVIIGQHGAALSNIFFMNNLQTQLINSNNCHLIEIVPPAEHISAKHFQLTARKHFENLAKSLNINYYSIQQTNDHSNVNIQQILEIVNNIVLNNESIVKNEMNESNYI